MTYEQVVSIIRPPTRIERIVADPERIVVTELTTDAQHQRVFLTYGGHVDWAPHAIVYVTLGEGRVVSVSVKEYGFWSTGGDSIYWATSSTAPGDFLGPDPAAAERAFRSDLP
jgi:hypothetical protein